MFNNNSPVLATVEACPHLARLGTVGFAMAALLSVKFGKYTDINDLPFLAAVVASAVTATTGVITMSSTIVVAVVAIGITIF